MTLPRNLSRYELLEEIGRGNMGVVYKARDPAIDRTVAIKVVRLGFSLDDKKREEYLGRFEREARIAGGLSHGNIIAVHDVGLENDEPYLVMEHFEGMDLGQLIREGPVAEDEARRILTELSGALAYAHAQGVVHRDIKPANVLYQLGGRVKLADFGIARLEASELTATGEFIGTPSYMAPETFAGEKIDGRSDLFSLGVLLYQLLTGNRPFEASSVSRTIYRVLHEEPEAPTSLRPELTPAWDFVCSRLLAKNPEERYPDAVALKNDLEALGRGTLVSKKHELAGLEPTQPIGWLSLWAGRSHSARAALFAAIAVAVAVAVAFFALLYLGPPRARGPNAAGAAPAAASSTNAETAIGEASSGDEAEAASADVPAHSSPSSPEFVPMSFVARHEHRVGHCTGDLTLGARGIRFESPRHDWRWANGQVRSFERRNETSLELVALDEDGEPQRYDFTFLRPSVARAEWERYARDRF